MAHDCGSCLARVPVSSDLKLLENLQETASEKHISLLPSRSALFSARSSTSSGLPPVAQDSSRSSQTRGADAATDDTPSGDEPHQREETRPPRERRPLKPAEKSIKSDAAQLLEPSIRALFRAPLLQDAGSSRVDSGTSSGGSRATSSTMARRLAQSRGGEQHGSMPTAHLRETGLDERPAGAAAENLARGKYVGGLV